MVHDIFRTMKKEDDIKNEEWWPLPYAIRWAAFGDHKYELLSSLYGDNFSEEFGELRIADPLGNILHHIEHAILDKICYDFCDLAFQGKIRSRGQIFSVPLEIKENYKDKNFFYDFVSHDLNVDPFGQEREWMNDQLDDRGNLKWFSKYYTADSKTGILRIDDTYSLIPENFFILYGWRLCTNYDSSRSYRPGLSNTTVFHYGRANWIPKRNDVDGSHIINIVVNQAEFQKHLDSRSFSFVTAIFREMSEQYLRYIKRRKFSLNEPPPKFADLDAAMSGTIYSRSRGQRRYKHWDKMWEILCESIATRTLPTNRPTDAYIFLEAKFREIYPKDELPKDESSLRNKFNKVIRNYQEINRNIKD